MSSATVVVAILWLAQRPLSLDHITAFLRTGLGWGRDGIKKHLKALCCALYSVLYTSDKYRHVISFIRDLLPHIIPINQIKVPFIMLNHTEFSSRLPPFLFPTEFVLTVGSGLNVYGLRQRR